MNKHYYWSLETNKLYNNPYDAKSDALDNAKNLPVKPLIDIYVIDDLDIDIVELWIVKYYIYGKDYPYDEDYLRRNRRNLKIARCLFEDKLRKMPLKEWRARQAEYQSCELDRLITITISTKVFEEWKKLKNPLNYEA